MEFNFGRLIHHLQGKTTMFLIAFFVMGHIMAWTHRLDAQYITFMTIILGYVIGHSYKEDRHEQSMATINQQEPGPDSQQAAGNPPGLSVPPQSQQDPPEKKKGKRGHKH